jgi:hypothetical protein
MTGDRRLGASVFAATLLLAVATLGLASVPPRPLRSALTVVHVLSFRVATDWLAVVALLAVGDRYVRPDRTVDRTTVVRLAAAVFLGGLAIEASPLARHVIDPEAVETAALVGGVVAAVQRSLFPAGLFLATVAGAAALSGGVLASRLGSSGRFPVAPPGGWVASFPSRAVARAALVLTVVGGVSFALELGARLAFGAPHVWLAVVDTAMGSLAGVLDHVVLAAAFLALVAAGVRLRSVAVGTAAVWVSLFAAGVVVAVLSAGLSVALVGLTTTPMAAVERTALGRWPAPASWALLLRTGTYLAGAVGLWTVRRRTRRRRDPPTDAGVGANDPRDA